MQGQLIQGDTLHTIASIMDTLGTNNLIGNPTMLLVECLIYLNSFRIEITCNKNVHPHTKLRFSGICVDYLICTYETDEIG